MNSAFQSLPLKLSMIQCSFLVFETIYMQCNFERSSVNLNLLLAALVYECGRNGRSRSGKRDLIKYIESLQNTYSIEYAEIDSCFTIVYRYICNYLYQFALCAKFRTTCVVNKSEKKIMIFTIFTYLFSRNLHAWVM